MMKFKDVNVDETTMCKSQKDIDEFYEMYKNSNNQIMMLVTNENDEFLIECNTKALAFGNGKVTVYLGELIAFDNVTIESHYCQVTAKEKSHIDAYSSQVELFDNSTAVAKPLSTIVAHDDSIVEQHRDTTVTVLDSAIVVRM